MPKRISFLRGIKSGKVVCLCRDALERSTLRKAKQRHFNVDLLSSMTIKDEEETKKNIFLCLEKRVMIEQTQLK